MKPFPRREDYAPQNPGHEPVEYQWKYHYQRARADWYESEVVPLLKEARQHDHRITWCGCRVCEAFRNRIDAVLLALKEAEHE